MTITNIPQNPGQALTAADPRRAFLEGMSRTAATVNIVTTDGPAGRAGVTVSAMSSVSADTANPTLLVCLNKDGSATARILDNSVFCVNVLRDDQSDIANIFAGRAGASGAERFASGDWATFDSGTPQLAGSLVTFDCRLSRALLVGTHYVVFGEVVGTSFGGAGRPLIYNARDYGSPCSAQESGVEVCEETCRLLYNRSRQHLLSL